MKTTYTTKEIDTQIELAAKDKDYERFTYFMEMGKDLPATRNDLSATVAFLLEEIRDLKKMVKNEK